jgi:hypothetical protein
MQHASVKGDGGSRLHFESLSAGFVAPLREALALAYRLHNAAEHAALIAGRATVSPVVDRLKLAGTGSACCQLDGASSSA